MSNIAVLGTTSTHGGSMISASGGNFTISGAGSVCRQGDSHSCPIRGHGVTPITSGCATHATVGGTPIAISGSVAGCGAVLNGSFAPKGDLI